MILLNSGFCTSANSQDFFCNYSNQGDNQSKKSEACIYNQMYNYSKNDTSAVRIISKILNLISLPANFSIEPCDELGTCRAFIYDGIRYIFYDKKFINNLINSDKNEWSLIEVLAHEIGHHLLGHTLKNANIEIHRKNELEADTFAGAIMARMGANENDALLSLLSIKTFLPSCEREIYEQYPCFESRKNFVLKGYRSIENSEKNTNFILPNNLENVDLTIDLLTGRKTISTNQLDSLYNSISEKENELSKYGEIAFKNSYYGICIKFLMRAKIVQSSGVWQSSYPYLIASLFIKNNPIEAKAMIKEMKSSLGTGYLSKNRPPIGFLISGFGEVKQKVPSKYLNDIVNIIEEIIEFNKN